MRRRNKGDFPSPTPNDDTTTTSDGNADNVSLVSGDNSEVGETYSHTDAIGQVLEDDSFKFTCRIPRWLFWGVFSFVVSVTVMMGCYMVVLRYMFSHHGVKTPTNMIAELGVDGMMLFRQYDRDDDGYLSIGEFEPLAHILRQTNATHEYPVEISDSDDVITIRGYMEPLQLSSMTKDLDSVFTGSLDAIIGLKSWQKPNIPWMNFGVSEFKIFLPKEEGNLEKVGDIYDIVSFSKGFFDGPLSNNRYYPPRIKDEEILIHRLLTLLHPRPFIHSRFSPQGSIGCVRAYNDRFISVVFRIHAEFQLNEPPFHPFWFTPAQFTGELIITRNVSSILYFNLFVPSLKNLNVDMEWLNGPRENENMEVDIGYLALMELNASSHSVPAVMKANIEGDPSTMEEQVISMKDVEQVPNPSLMQIKNSIEWTEEISMEEVTRKLEVEMYSFKQIPYLNFSDAYVKAEAEQKLVHHILLWGALDDQSC